MVKLVENLSHVILKPGDNNVDLYTQAYKLWRRVWSKTYKHLKVNGRKKLNSDDFFHREVSCLMYKDRVIALMLHHVVNFECEIHKDHSYFNNYSSKCVKVFQEKGIKKALVLSYISVDEMFRSNKVGVSMPDLLFTLSMRRFLELDMEHLAWYIRTDMEFYKTFFKFGASDVFRDNAYNVEVAYCSLSKKDLILNHDTNITKIVDRIYQNQLKQSAVS